MTWWFFQAMFCATAATIVSGAVAERMQFKAYMVGGMAALMGAIILGPREGWSATNGLRGQNTVFSVLGTFLLWFGWYGFNCVSTGGIAGQGNTIGLIAVNTTIGAAFGGVTAVI